MLLRPSLPTEWICRNTINVTFADCLLAFYLNGIQLCLAAATAAGAVTTWSQGGFRLEKHPAGSIPGGSRPGNRGETLKSRTERQTSPRDRATAVCVRPLQPRPSGTSCTGLLPPGTWVSSAGGWGAHTRMNCLLLKASEGQGSGGFCKPVGGKFLLGPGSSPATFILAHSRLCCGLQTCMRGVCCQHDVDMCELPPLSSCSCTRHVLLHQLWRQSGGGGRRSLPPGAPAIWGIAALVWATCGWRCCAESSRAWCSPLGLRPQSDMCPARSCNCQKRKSLQKVLFRLQPRPPTTVLLALEQQPRNKQRWETTGLRNAQTWLLSAGAEGHRSLFMAEDG